jgi:hypothetical protein
MIKFWISNKYGFETLHVTTGYAIPFRIIYFIQFQVESLYLCYLIVFFICLIIEYRNQDVTNKKYVLFIIHIRKDKKLPKNALTTGESLLRNHNIQSKNSMNSYQNSIVFRMPNKLCKSNQHPIDLPTFSIGRHLLYLITPSQTWKDKRTKTKEILNLIVIHLIVSICK